MSSSSLATYYREQPLPWLEACSRGTHSPLSPAPPSFVSSKSDPSLQLEQRCIPLRHTDPLPSLPQGKVVPTTGPLPWFLSRTFSGQLLSNPSGCSSKKPLWPQPPSRAPPACQHLCCPDLEQYPAGAGLRLAEGTGPSPAYGHQRTNAENVFTLQLWQRI